MSKKKLKRQPRSQSIFSEVETPVPVAQQRVIVRITPDGDWWKLTQEPPSYYICRSRKQRKMKKLGQLICSSLMEEGRPSQLVGHEANGTIGFENTFLADPRDTPG